MRLTTIDLYEIAKCSKRWLEDPPLQKDQTSPVRELIKQMILLKGAGKQEGWDFSSIANYWDSIFWAGREVNRENMDLSIKGILAARKLYRHLPKENVEIFSTAELTSSIDSSIEIFSSGDFVIVHPDRIETWIYTSIQPKDIRRSILPAAEHLLIQKKVRAAQNRPFFLVVYKATMRGLSPGYAMIASTGAEAGNEMAIMQLCNIARRKISIPTICEHCNNCKVDC
jgi:hypothetical protein